MPMGCSRLHFLERALLGGAGPLRCDLVSLKQPTQLRAVNAKSSGCCGDAPLRLAQRIENPHSLGHCVCAERRLDGCRTRRGVSKGSAGIGT